MSLQELVEVDGGELAAAGAGEVEQAVDDLGGAEGLLGDLFEDGRELAGVVGAHVLGEHLGVGGDDGERGVDLVGDTGGEQADGGELFRLGELAFELDAVGDVVDEDDAADLAIKVARDERGDGDVGYAEVTIGQGEAELVEGVGAVDAVGVADAGELLDELRREDGGERLAEGLAAGLGVHLLHGGVPALDAVRRGRRRRRRC